MREAKATGGWRWKVDQDIGGAPNYNFTPDAASTITPPSGWSAMADGSEQDETQPWALLCYDNILHWRG